MKKIANLLLASTFLMVLFFIVLKITGHGPLYLPFVKIRPTMGLLFAIILMLTAIFLKLSLGRKVNLIKGGTIKGKVFFFIASVAIAVIFLKLLLFYDQLVINQFRQIYLSSGLINKAHYLGIHTTQNPCDNWSMQEIISEIKPDFIIETGTYRGGTTLHYASILRNVNEDGKVITVDIEDYTAEAAKYDLFKERVEFILSDSVSPKVIATIRKRIKGAETVLVTLDSLHTKEHVLKELNLYSDFVTVGSYIVVQDTMLCGGGVAADFPEGPMEAVEEFLKTNKNFEIDRGREKYLLTFYPSGYLKRVR